VLLVYATSVTPSYLCPFCSPFFLPRNATRPTLAWPSNCCSASRIVLCPRKCHRWVSSDVEYRMSYTVHINKMLNDVFSMHSYPLIFSRRCRRTWDWRRTPTPIPSAAIVELAWPPQLPTKCFRPPIRRPHPPAPSRPRPWCIRWGESVGVSRPCWALWFFFSFPPDFEFLIYWFTFSRQRIQSRRLR